MIGVYEHNVGYGGLQFRPWHPTTPRCVKVKTDARHMLTVVKLYDLDTSIVVVLFIEVMVGQIDFWGLGSHSKQPLALHIN